MECNFFQLYFFSGSEKNFFAISPQPLLDLSYFQTKENGKVTILTQPLPVVLAQYLLKEVNQKSPRNWDLNKLGKILEKLPFKLNLAPQEWEQGLDLPFPLGKALAEAQAILEGRILFSAEVEWALKERKFSYYKCFREITHLLCLEGKAKIQEGVNPNGECGRCGNKDLKERKCWWREGLTCLFCPQCLSMGQCRLCSLLYSFSPRLEREGKFVSLKLDFSLTPPQEEASQKLEEFLARKEKEFLLWAVCGAGKTEVTYPAIKKILSQGERVLLAIPRREVVRELLPRLQLAFPDSEISALYGGAGEKYSSAQLVIATTHQAIRFYQSFVLVVLDEVDAYPYRDNAMLKYAVKRACHPRGKIIYLTATPEKDILRLPKTTISARHHRFPLPVPGLFACSLPSLNEIKEQGLPPTILHFLEESVEKDKCQVFLFLPTIKLTVEVGKWLKEYYWQKKSLDWVEYSHSQDPEREEKKDRFSQGEFPFLVTTTIMERGVTIPRLNVIVLHSDQEKIFNTPSLIQIAGRAGRKKDYPEGRVVFIGNKINSSMQEAREMIKTMNKEAWHKGYLDRKP